MVAKLTRYIPLLGCGTNKGDCKFPPVACQLQRICTGILQGSVGLPLPTHKTDVTWTDLGIFFLVQKNGRRVQFMGPCTFLCHQVSS